MQIRCPHCRNPIDATDDTSLAEVNCPTCGSTFNLIAGDSTLTHRAESRRLANFELIREIGAGKFGSVWFARDTQLDRSVAIKIPRHGSLDAREAEMFLRDARAAAQLRHPNIVGVHEVGRENDTVYIVTDYIKGANLKEWLTGQRLSFRESAEMINKVADALHHAHQAGVVHRDLKPGNIMIDVDGEPHVIDFGLARRETGEVTMTVDGHILGTPAYMSPEQAAGKGHQADGRSDVYSIGVILFELMTGELPFRGETQMLLLQIERDEPPRPRKLNAKIPRDLETITLKCLQKEPSRRYQSAEDVAADIQRWLEGKPIVARPVGRGERGWRWCRRNPIVTGLAATVLVALTGGTVVSSYFAIEANARASEAVVERTRAEVNLLEASSQRERANAERKTATDNLIVAEKQRLRAEESNRRARQAVDEYYTRVSQSTLLEEPRFVHLRKELLQAALNYYQGFLQDHGDEPSLLGDISATQLRVAGLTNEVGASGWLEPLQAGFRNVDRLVAENRELGDFGSLVAGTYKNRSANIQLPLGQPKELVNTLVGAQSTYKELVRRFPHVTGFRNDLAGIDHALGMVYRIRGKMSIAMTTFQSSRDNWEQLVRDHPDVNDYEVGLAGAYMNIGIIYGEFGLSKEQLAAHQRAFEVSDRLVNRNPHASTFMQMLIVSAGNLARAQWQMGKREAANCAFERKLVVLEQLHHEYPGDKERCKQLALEYLASVNRISEIAGLDEAGAVDRPDLVERIDKSFKLVAPDNSVYADLCIAAGRWSEAASSLAIQLERAPHDHLRWCQTACLDAYLADRDAHHGRCQLMLARFSNTKDKSIAERVAKACLALPIQEDALEQSIRLADRAVAAGSSHSFHRHFELVKGLAEFRAGRFESAGQWLTKCLSSSGTLSANCQTAATLLQAMTENQLGNQDTARSWLSKAKRNSRIDKSWHDWLLAETLRREAEDLIAHTPSTKGLTEQPAIDPAE